MSLKNKTFQIILRVICGLFFVIAIFLSVTAVVYAAGDGTPNIFGSNVYLVKTDAFDVLKSGTAMIASKVPPSEIQPPNIVIFNLENGKPALAQVLSSNLYDGVYSFSVRTENNAEITLSQSQIVAKGMSISPVLGALISFAVSPFGMLIIAIVPSIIIIILEIVKFAGKIMPQPEIETIKKQYEVPTYAPTERGKTERRGTAEAAKAYRSASLDSSIGIYDTGMSEAGKGRKPDPRSRGDYAEIAARQQAAQQSQQSPLFTPPTRRPQSQQPRAAKPLSSQKLTEAIEATKAEHELEDMNKVRAQVVKDIQKTRGAAIAAEKEFESREKAISKEARKTSDLAKTAVISELTKRQTSELAQAARRTSSAEPSRPTLQSPRTRQTQSRQSQSQQSSDQQSGRRIQRPALKLDREEPVRQYTPNRSTNTTTSIPRLDSLLREDSDSGAPYNLDDILAGLDRKHG